MSRAQVPTLDFFHCLAHNFPLYGPMFAGSSKRLQRGAREGLWSNLGHWLHFGRRRVQMWREHIRQTGDLKQSAPKPCEVWMLVLKLISFSHFFPLLPSIIFLWALFTSYSASGPLKSLSLHPHFVPPYASLCHPFLSMQLFAALLPCFFPPVHPSFTLLLPTSQLKVIWHSSGQVRAWQCFEVWVYHAQSGRDEMRAKGQPQAAPGALGRGLTALDIQKLILGQTTVPHEGKQCLHSTGSLWPETGLVPSRIPLCCAYTEGNGRCF